jgi:hypothetical protein
VEKYGSSPREARPEPSHLVAVGPPLELQGPPLCGNYSFVVGKLQYEKEQELQWNGTVRAILVTIQRLSTH